MEKIKSYNEKSLEQETKEEIGKYKDFKDLIKHNKEDIDFEIKIDERNSQFLIIAIHGGNIEPGTTEIAEAISGKNFSFYSFIGKKNSEKESENLHITSSNFDEPRCCDLVRGSSEVISIHGKAGADNFVMVGGLDDDFAEKITNALKTNNFEIRQATENVNGKTTRNICNRGLSKKGVQFEISRGYRNRFLEDPDELLRFSKVIRGAINDLSASA